jgi:hypothetical protein
VHRGLAGERVCDWLQHVELRLRLCEKARQALAVACTVLRSQLLLLHRYELLHLLLLLRCELLLLRGVLLLLRSVLCCELLLRCELLLLSELGLHVRVHRASFVNPGAVEWAVEPETAAAFAAAAAAAATAAAAAAAVVPCQSGAPVQTCSIRRVDTTAWSGLVWSGHTLRS